MKGKAAIVPLKKINPCILGNNVFAGYLLK
jgi:hypothetical protein